MDKINMDVENVRQIPAGCRQNKQDAEDVRQMGSRRC